MKLKFSLFLMSSFVLLTGCSSTATLPTYEATVKGHNGDVKVQVELEDETIVAVNILEHAESAGVADKALSGIPKAIIDNQSLDVDLISGCSVSSAAIIEGTKKALTDGGVNIDKYLVPVTADSSAPTEDTTVFSKGWDATPNLGITKGDYYKETGKFGRGEGHTGIMEVVMDNDNILMIEFNEFGRPDYHTLAYADYKRFSDYNFMMGEIQGTAWIQGVLHAEQVMLEQQSLVAEIDYVTGASETITQGLEPLAAQLNARIPDGTNQKFYRIAEDLGGGITGVLNVILEDGKIIDHKYDEIFATSQDDIEDPKYKKYYRTSKYENNMYKDNSKIGFRWQMDRLNERVIETQDLFDIAGLPAAQDDDDARKNPSYDSYLKLAEKLHAVMLEDKAIY